MDLKPNKIFLFLLLGGALLCTNLTAQAQDTTVNTYHLSPKGNFDYLQLIPRSTICASPPCATAFENCTGLDGTIYSNRDQNNALMLCQPVDANNSFWRFLPGVWQQTGDMISFSDPAHYKEIFLGLGTTTPEYRLTIKGDGGIFARGSQDTGALLTANMQGAKFIWYPRKRAIYSGSYNYNIYENFDSVDPTNDGRGSVNFSYSHRTEGNFSTAYGICDIANGGCLNLGRYSTVGGGQNGSAPGEQATLAGGKDGYVSGDWSFSPGGGSISGDYASTLSLYPNPSGKPVAATQSGDYSFVGTRARSSGLYSVSSGADSDISASSGTASVSGACDVVDAAHSTSLTSLNTLALNRAATRNHGIRSFSMLSRAASIIPVNDIYSTSATVIGGHTNAIGDSANINVDAKSFQTAIYTNQLNSPNGYTTHIGTVMHDFPRGTANPSGAKSFTGPVDRAKTILSGGDYATVANGTDIADTGDYSFVGTGENIQAAGLHSTVLFGSNISVNGDNSMAAGSNMQLSATADDTCAWGFGSWPPLPPITITQPNAFLILSDVVGIGTTKPNFNAAGVPLPPTRVHVNGDIRINGPMHIQAPPTATISGDNRMMHTGGGYVNSINNDIAETFTTSEKVEIGDVLVTDPKHPLKLKKSRKPYSANLIGIVSGAPAAVFEGSQLKIAPAPFSFTAGTKPPVALAGRVAVKISLENGPIQPGDLLTSSSKAGYAMKAMDRERGRHAIVAKALESFTGGPNGEKTGMIEVIVLTR